LGFRVSLNLYEEKHLVVLSPARLSRDVCRCCSRCLQVLIAACDTFRSGAVEQLKTHCARLGVPLYEKGYEKDPARVAAEAIKQAARTGCDAVLVDTAGERV